MYIPSYDFRIFDLPMFSPLQAQEFGAATSFSANTPTSYIDNSLNQFAALLNPRNLNPYPQNQFPVDFGRFDFENFFQSQDAITIRDRATKVRDQAQSVIDEINGKRSSPSTDDCKQGRNIFGGCGPILGSKKVISDGTGTMGDKEAPAGMQTFETFLNALPQGAGIFLIAIVVIVLLFLFVKR
ncbi:MAG TPA: hypothetical protein VH815_03065 [Acidobacteriota bacterium]|jgi:hypothetical protein